MKEGEVRRFVEGRSKTVTAEEGDERGIKPKKKKSHTSQPAPARPVIAVELER